MAQGSGHEFNGTVWHPTHGYVNSCDGELTWRICSLRIMCVCTECVLYVKCVVFVFVCDLSLDLYVSACDIHSIIYIYNVRVHACVRTNETLYYTQWDFTTRNSLHFIHHT